MATTIKLAAYLTSVTVLASELNSLANGSVSGLTGSGTGTILDNTSNLSLYADFELDVTFGSAPTLGNTIGLYMATSLDGTNYEIMPAAGTTAPQNSKLVGSFVLESTGTTQRIHIWRVPLTPGKMEFQALNSAGVAFPASGSTIVCYPYSLQSV
ncbi:MAG: hypothetical protein KGH75_00780 [Rhodospirillales bacterium]|nr:hypothetical protein [Rhodospirillales bacterium]